VDGGLSVRPSTAAAIHLASEQPCLAPKAALRCKVTPLRTQGNVRLKLGVKRQPLAGSGLLCLPLPNTRGTSASGLAGLAACALSAGGRFANSCNGALNLNGLGWKDELCQAHWKIERLAPAS